MELFFLAAIESSCLVSKGSLLTTSTEVILDVKHQLPNQVKVTKLCKWCKKRI